MHADVISSGYWYLGLNVMVLNSSLTICFETLTTSYGQPAILVYIHILYGHDPEFVFRFVFEESNQPTHQHFDFNQYSVYLNSHAHCVCECTQVFIMLLFSSMCLLPFYWTAYLYHPSTIWYLFCIIVLMIKRKPGYKFCIVTYPEYSRGYALT